MNYTIASEFTVLIDAIETHLVGKRETIALSLATFFAGGHLLLEDIPGVGKTTLAKHLSQVLGLDFGRIQFTSDMLPSDILGVNYYNQKEGAFIFKKGPIFTSFLLADEINRSMPKTQSALLQAMEEGSISIDGTLHTLPKPFFVIGTQNPHEEVGTFPLPTSQLDRFMCSFGIGYPDSVSEREILKGERGHSSAVSETLLRPQQIESYMKQASEVTLSETLLDFLQEIIAYTRESGVFEYGLSTRGALSLTAMTRSWAMLQGRTYATADDLQAVTAVVCSHRLQFKEGSTTAKRIHDEIFTHVRSDI
ncbi:AAA family ATPase [Sulfurovum sp. XGS-02]|uniref:AAA family ATPase n=1 Tax=Sulfurovum sp. XGS-02 TaxID=2925411 RepID=UPI00206DD563|nr:MoxR family ATPase [Sulfurovum sp. XGS-02]UPT76555.1 AAA family ATPase [Sulfurovum sp. XGS-02]